MNSPERKYSKTLEKLRSINPHQPLTPATFALYRKYASLMRQAMRHANNVAKKYHMPTIPHQLRNMRHTYNVLNRANRALLVERNRLRQAARNLAALKHVAPYEVYTLVKPYIYSPKKPKKPNSPTTQIRRLFIHK